MEAVDSAITLAAAVAVPYLSGVAKTKIVPGSDTDLWKDNSTGGPGWRWKPHKRHRGIIWPVLYAFLGTASWLVWREGGFDRQAWPLTLYAGLLFANLLAWPPVFVGSRDVPHACMDCIVLLGMSLATFIKFFEVSSLAGLLLLPYLAWSCFASTLINLSISHSEPQVGKASTDAQAARGSPGLSTGAHEKLPDDSLRRPLLSLNEQHQGQHVQGQDQRAAGFSSFQTQTPQPLGSPLPIFSGQSPSKQHFAPAGLTQQPQQQQLPQQAPQQGGPTRGRLRAQEERALQQSGLAAAPMPTPFSSPAQGANSMVPGGRIQPTAAAFQGLQQVQGLLSQAEGAVAVNQEAGRPVRPPESIKSCMTQAASLLTQIAHQVSLSAEYMAGMGAVSSGMDPVGQASRGPSDEGGLPAPLFRPPPPQQAQPQPPRQVPQAAPQPRLAVHQPHQPAGPPPDPAMGPNAWPLSDTVDLQYFSSPVPEFKVRGPDYLQDKKKVPAAMPICKLSSVNLAKVAEPTFHIARFYPTITRCNAPFTLVWQIMVPGRQHISLSFAWSYDKDPLAVAGAYTDPESAHLEVEGSAHSSSSILSAPGSAAMVPTPDRPGHRRTHTADNPDSIYSSSAQANGLQRERSYSFPDVDQLHAEEHPHARRPVQASGSAPDLNALTEARGSNGYPASEPDSPMSIKGGGARAQLPGGTPSPFDVALARLIQMPPDAPDKQRQSQFKIIPRLEKGSWIMRQSVGQNTPVLLGRKITTKYFRGPRYLEIDTDVGSSSTAHHVTGMVQGALKSVIVDIGVLMEGRATDELPEALLGTVRFAHLDLSKAADLDTERGHIVRNS
ncbi:hypothetical protein WJX84_011314 [Apatococcus fuscideae]|uniref:Protein ENHANCED DISEASE RESISTANCE 2 C-terminal domain-containing protein n=1 Tax=Apatococcus fuscideae TaxID=2026836 RepID=A0AAW1T5C4_9CHLO